MARKKKEGRKEKEKKEGRLVNKSKIFASDFLEFENIRRTPRRIFHRTIMEWFCLYKLFASFCPNGAVPVPYLLDTI